ncbi:MAG: hypothetical protein CMN05_06450 [Roseibacillus sp.]|jgi:hypothetical protein|nr:hypothetical protein [Roseibacillus sp.]MBP34629.1 hypothetical protein [Roseibacillus sp.]MCP4729183.1 hypothetical protein [Roseibacillus sp.]MDP7306927.1 hypothetical protein [Roseibacillus sp.]HJM64079.1 hypothetical protein [Roseibacillus sp.]|tara:strand:+ start:410 stop:1255 length:846 start_codon:yes stop_codon:yes gene_type:complete
MNMNASQLSLLGLLALGSSLSGEITGSTPGHKDPYTPVGAISVTPTVVQPGVRPKMEWNIDYPLAVVDLSEVDPNGTITPTQEIDLKIRVMGVALQSGHTLLPAALWVRVGASAPWELVFYGRENDVNPDEVVYEKKNVQPGTQIDFSARGQSGSGSWFGTHSTAGSDLSVIGMIDGDSVPDYAPAYEQGRIESFMTQFLNEDNHVVLGPHDIIHTFELGSSNPGDWWFDMQDIVCTTTLSQTRRNSGGGSFLSSVDLSTQTSSSATVDDNGKIIRGRKER